MEITPTSNFNRPSSENISSRDEALERADFLKMLTTQLQSQDPLNPLESHEYASQLATFSQLQELEDINANLGSSLDTNLLLTQSINNNMAATMVGKYVRAELNTVNVGSAGDVNLHYHLPEAATDISIDVKNANGEIVDTFNVPPQQAGDVTAVWDGRNSEGVRVPEGEYSFQVHAKNVEGENVPVDSYVEGMVSAVNYVDGGVRLMIDGIEVRLGQVLSIMNEAPEQGGTNSQTLSNG